MENGSVEVSLLIALQQRNFEHANSLEDFVPKLMPSLDLERLLYLAHVAVRVVSFPSGRNK